MISLKGYEVAVVGEGKAKSCNVIVLFSAGTEQKRCCEQRNSLKD